MDEDLQRTTYHEAGHAVMAAFLGGIVDRITVEPEDDDGEPRFGDTRVLWPSTRWTPRQLAVNEIKAALAGPVAEMIYGGDQYAPVMLTEWRCDWQLAVARAAGFLPTKETYVPYLNQMISELIVFFSRDDVWAAVAALADELEAHETLDRENIAVVMRTWNIG